MSHTTIDHAHLCVIWQGVDAEIADAAKESVTLGQLVDKMALLCRKHEELHQPIHEIFKLLEASSSNL